MTSEPPSDRAHTVGFIGLGKMGAGMATNLLKAGRRVVVYDIDPAKNAYFAEQGAVPASGPREVAERGRTVITMVDTTAQSRDVIVGPEGIISAAQPGDAVICMSTIDPEAVKAMHATLAARGVGLIEAPVTGMIKGAIDGTLRAFVGGDPETLESCRSVLEPMTSEIIHIGPIGHGLTMKLINNMLSKINSIAAIEGIVLGAKAGLDPQLMLDVIGKSTGNSPAFQYRAQRIIDRNFDGVRLDISCKDLELETSLGSALHVPLFLANVTKQVYEMGRAAGYGDLDATVIVQIYEQLTGITVGEQAGESAAITVGGEVRESTGS